MTVTTSGAGRFSIGRVFAESFGVMRRRAGLFAVLALIFSVVPTLLFAVVRTLYPIDPDDVLAQMRGAPGENLVTTLLNLAMSIAVIKAVLTDLAGGRPTFASSMQGMGKHFPGAVGQTIVSNIGIGLGLLLFVVPGLILMAMWYVCLPVKVHEEKGALVSLDRSAKLTEGNRAAIVGFALLWVMGATVGVVILFLLIGFILGLIAPASVDMVLDFVALPPVFALLFIFAPVSSAVAYAELKRLNGEPVGSSVAAVFD